MAWKAVLLSLLLAGQPLAWGQGLLPGLTGVKGDKAAKGAAPQESLADQRQRAEKELAAAQRRREEIAMTTDNGNGGEASVSVTERQRLSDLLVFLRSEKVRRLDQIVLLEKTPQPQVADHPLAKALGATPPYAVLAVDAVRDQLERLQEQLSGFNSILRIQDLEKQSTLEKTRKAEEALRLAGDQAAKADGEAARENAQRARDVASLRHLAAEAELSLRDTDQQLLRLQASRLQEQIDAWRQLVEIVLPHQEFSAEVMEEKRASLREQQEKLAAEVDAITARSIRQSAEQARRLVAGGASPERKAEEAAVLDQILQTNNVTLESLRGLLFLTRVAADAWESRYVAMTATDAEQRQEAVNSLKKIYDGIAAMLSSRKQLQEQRDNVRVAIGEQESKLSLAQPDSGEYRQAKAILPQLREQVIMLDRVEQSVDRGNRQMRRWLEDFSDHSSLPWQERAKRFYGEILAGLQGLWNYEIFSVEDISEVDGRKISVRYGVTIGKSIGALLLFGFGYWLFSLASRLLERFLVRRAGIDAQLASVIRRWVMVSVAVFLVITVLNLARIPLAVFAFLGGALAIGIGFGTQTIIKNFISGIILLFERKVRVGDIIALNGVTGYVTAVDLRATTVRAFDGVEALVPNSTFLESQVVNWTYSNSRIRREVRIGIAYGASTREAADILQKCAEEHGQILKEPAPEVFLEDFGDNALVMVLVYWIELAAGTGGRRVDSDLRFMLEKRLTATGIGIPFPQRDLHIDAPVPVRVVE